MKELVLKNIIGNPLFWIGIILTIFTLNYETEGNIYNIFFSLNTYRNLFIGSFIYVAIFNVKYTKHHKKIDFLETFYTCIHTMAIILFVWLLSLSMYVGYHQAGEEYSDTLRARYTKLKNDPL